MKLASIKIDEHWPHGFGKGATPATSCTVELQYGDTSYERIKIVLPSEAVREVVTLAVTKALEQLSIDPLSLNVEGSPGEPIPEPVWSDDCRFEEDRKPELNAEVL